MQTIKIGSRSYLVSAIVWFEHHQDIKRMPTLDDRVQYINNSKFSIGFSDGSKEELRGAEATRFASAFETMMTTGI